ncbi:hypothetical protein HQ393_05320 [Chitinibacter bivalviorum]|uniref:LysM domain-containing protein n=1 Tax=Chitinibacter bivalviorum TaxID=2739434 RepID=A0A7H9BG80_9NEIS|nr:FimV/HubP family polar landmark protein [Chitinibacter bivalviorum]QLG87720.1 hypothetical protein HQ393_05320 [Chitinibacter bivalviorum]
MQKSPRFKACVLAVAMAAMPLLTQAAGLGRLNVLSGLGQPFRGEIDLVSVQPNEADSLVVSLAPPESYSTAQIAYPPASLGLRFNIEKRAGGQYYVVVNSTQPISEPFLDLLVELNWAAGRIQREYTALIDPADYSGGSSADKARFASTALPGARTSGAIKEAKQPKQSKSTATTPAPKTPQQHEATSGADSNQASTTGDSYKVKAGDSLSSIAKQVQPSGVSLEQVLVSLYRSNAAAFDGNMNRLKRGKILHVPAADEMKQVSKAEAAKEITVQAADWHSYRGKLAESAAKAPAKDLGEQSSGGKITAKVQDQGASATDKNKDVLKLSKAADAAKKAGDASKLQALEEEIATRQKALDEANQRVAALQKNVADMEKLAALKAKASAEPIKASTLVTAAPVASSVVASGPVAAVASEPVVAAASVASKVASEVAKPKRRVQVEAPVVEEPSFIDGLLEDPLTLGGGILALALGAGGLWYARRRQKPGVFEDSIITGGDLKANTVLGSTGGGVISTQATENSFLTDFSRQGLGTIDTDEVDPIAEAEVYMAYGRDAQAEEILKDALQKDPTRHEIRMKLLDIYAARRDVASYEEHASTLFAVTNGQGENWHSAAMNGRAIDPENPLYHKEPAGVVDTSSVVAPAVAVAAVAGVMAMANSSDAPSLDEPTAPDVMQSQDTSLDFELDLDAKHDNSVSDFAADLSLDAPPSIGDLDLDLAVDNADAAALDAVAESDFALNEDFKLPSPTLDAVEELTDVNSDSLMSLDLPIDLGTESGELSALEDLADLDLSVDLPSVDLDGLDVELPSVETISASNLDFGNVTLPDFDVPVAGAVEALAELPHAEQSESMDDDLKLDFDFDLAGAGAEPLDVSAEAEPVGLSALEADSTFGDISLDLTEAAAAGELDFAADDPVQTKIDLARAYIDMGDVEGAREILQEAVQEGTESQQQVAKSLLADL